MVFARVAVGTSMHVSVFAPGQEWHGTVSVARCLARPSRDGFDTWHIGVRFEEAGVMPAVEEFQRWEAA